jgi:hypothetical protein
MNTSSEGYRQGIYKPINRGKYKGLKLPIYRSGYELKFFRWCDANTKVLEWGSESVIIPYMNPVDQKYHRYFVDNYIKFQKDGVLHKYLIEIKPSYQTIRPIKGRKKPTTFIYEAKTYIQNKAKWEAAEKWCDQKGYKFLILTEKELNIK